MPAEPQGGYWTSTVADIRESGRVPAYTDFIHAVRRRLFE